MAADIMGTSTLVICRTDAESAKLITSDVDERDHPFLTGERTAEGFYRLKDGTEFERCVARGLAFAPYSDLLWMETSTPDLDQARRFAEAIRAEYPDQMLAYNCSPSFNWAANLDEADIARFQREIGAMGYKFQFVTLAGFHSLNHGMYELARGYKDRGMAATSSCRTPSSPARSTATPQPVTSARLAPATSTRCPSRSKAAPLRPPLSADRPRKHSSNPASPNCRRRPNKSQTVGRKHQPELKEEYMSNRYWVIGGEFETTAFDRVLDGTQRIMGPYGCREQAKQA